MMVCVNKSLKLGNLPKELFALPSMSACEKSTLRKMLEDQLNQVRLTLKRIETSENKKISKHVQSSSSETDESCCTTSETGEEGCKDGFKKSKVVVSGKRGALMELECGKVKKQRTNVERRASTAAVNKSGKRVEQSVVKCDAGKHQGLKGSHSTIPTPYTASLVIDELQQTSNMENRAAFLKKRFAGIILKAQECIGLKREFVQKERIRGADQVGLKKQREKERTAARIAVHKMTKTVDIYEDPQIVEEIERLRYDGCIMGNPLEWFGLVLKNEYIEELEEDDTFSNQVEEGEIVD